MKSKEKPIPYAVLNSAWSRAQGKLQGYLTDQMNQLEQLRLGLSKEDQKLLAHMEASQLVVGTLPPIVATNLADKLPIVGIRTSWINLPYEELLALATHPETYIRAMLAISLGPEKRHQRPAEILSADDAHIVRRSLAHNMFTTTRTLGLLAEDKDIWVRRRVAYHWNLPLWLAKKLLQDPDEDVRVMAAMHYEELGGI